MVCNKKERRFNKITGRYLKVLDYGELDFQHIPIVNFDKKLLEVDTIEKEKFFCYINWDDIEMDETLFIQTQI